MDFAAAAVEGHFHKRFCPRVAMFLSRVYMHGQSVVFLLRGYQHFLKVFLHISTFSRTDPLELSL